MQMSNCERELLTGRSLNLLKTSGFFCYFFKKRKKMHLNNEVLDMLCLKGKYGVVKAVKALIIDLIDRVDLRLNRNSH